MKRFVATIVLIILCFSACADEDLLAAKIGDYTIGRNELDRLFDASYGDYSEEDEDLVYQLRYELLYRWLTDRCEQIMEEKMGFNELSEDQLLQAEQNAQEEYDYYVSYYMYLFGDVESDEEALRQLAIEAMDRNDMSLETFLNQAIANISDNLLFDWAVSDLTISEEELLAYYEDVVAADKAAFAVSPDDFIIYKYYGVTATYNPAGFRVVRMIHIAFDSIQQEQYNSLYTRNATEDQYQTLYAQLEPRTKEALNQLSAGRAFVDVEAEYSDDYIYYADSIYTGDLYICEGSKFWGQEFTEAAMALTEVGEWSDPVYLDDGIYIICYMADVEEGAVDYAVVSDYILDVCLYATQTEYYYQKIDQWMEDLDMDIYMDALE